MKAARFIRRCLLLLVIIMSKVATGSIPEKISYVFSDEQEVAVGCEWDISWFENEEHQNTKVKVLPAFPVDSTDDKTMQRAKSWAAQGEWDPNTYQHKPATPQIEEVDNKPIKDVKVLSLEQRGNGGRAYKALIGKYYVDLREDVLMDTLLQAGVAPGGILQGEYVWAKSGSQMKLVRIGSELHRLIAEFESKKDIKPVGKKDLEVGGVYRDRKKNTAIFVGYVNTTVFKKEEFPTWSERSYKKPTFNFPRSEIKKAMLFYEVYDFEGLDKSVKQMKSKDSDYQFKIKKSHTYIEKIKNVTIPDDLIPYLRNKATKVIKNMILEYTGHKQPKQGYAAADGWTLSEYISYHSEHLNLYPFGGEPVDLFDVKKFLLFS